MRGCAWLILPTYDEAANLAGVVADARAVLARAAPEGFTILVVDDSSPDGTGRIADALSAAHPEVEVLHRPAKLGLGSAYRDGFRRALEAGAGRVLQMDADFSHDPRDLAKLLEVVGAGADLAIGSRYVNGGGVRDWGMWRRAVSRAGCWYARRVLGVGVRDLTGGLKCFRAGALVEMDHAAVRSSGYAYQVELTWRALRCRMQVTETPIVFAARRAGRSKMTPRIALEAAWMVPALRLRGHPGRRGGAGRAVIRGGSAILMVGSLYFLKRSYERGAVTWPIFPP